MAKLRTLRLSASIQRKSPRLPVYVFIPGAHLASWGLTRTSIIEGTANGHGFGRRTIKAWGQGSDAWFVEFTASFCKAAGLKDGDPVELEISLAETSMPDELNRSLMGERGLADAWSKLPERQKREAAEYVRAAKNQATRDRRAASIIEKLTGQRCGGGNIGIANI